MPGWYAREEQNGRRQAGDIKKPHSTDIQDSVQSTVKHRMSLATRELYVLYYLSLIDMERTIRSMDLLPTVHNAHIRTSLFRDAIVCYSKPFSSNKGISGKAGLRVSDAFVPGELKSAHTQILAFRNKLFAHMDIDNQAPNVSVDVIDGNNHVSFSVAGYEVAFTDHLIIPLRALAMTAHKFIINELASIENSIT